MTCPPTLDGTIIPAQRPRGNLPGPHIRAGASGFASNPAICGDVLVGLRVIRGGMPSVQRHQAGWHHLQAGEVLLDLCPGAAGVLGGAPRRSHLVWFWAP